MTVYDRWHLTHPREDATPCRCSRGRAKLYPSGDHGSGDRWQVRWREENGKQCKRNFPKKDGTDADTCAEAFDALITTQLNSDTYVDPDAGKITLGAYAASWRAGLTSDLSTLQTVDRHLAHIADLYGKRLRALSKRPSAVQQWISGLQGKGLAPGTIKVIVGTLSSVFNAAIDDGIIARNPTHAKSVKPPPVPKRKVQPWTAAQVRGAAAEVETRHSSGAMVFLGAAAGLREGEVFALAEEDVVFLGRDRRILVRRQVKRVKDGDGVWRLLFAPPKGGKDREVPLSDAMAARLAAHLKARPAVAVTLPWRTPAGKPAAARLLFTRPGGRAWYGQAFQYTWDKAREAGNAPDGEDGRFHGLRHTFASACLADGVDIRTLADWLGHTDPGFTLRTYTHLMPTAAARGRRAIDTFLAGSADGDSSALNVPQGDQL
jgi:integrase